MIYKICSKSLWQQAVESGKFSGAPVDLADGFIHFSAPGQVKETAEKHFSGQADLLLIAIDENRLGDNLKWEKSRGGQLFPHLFGTFPPELAEEVVELPVSDLGQHVFPPNFD